MSVGKLADKIVLLSYSCLQRPTTYLISWLSSRPKGKLSNFFLKRHLLILSRSGNLDEFSTSVRAAVEGGKADVLVTYTYLHDEFITVFDSEGLWSAILESAETFLANTVLVDCFAKLFVRAGKYELSRRFVAVRRLVRIQKDPQKFGHMIFIKEGGGRFSFKSPSIINNDHDSSVHTLETLPEEIYCYENVDLRAGFLVFKGDDLLQYDRSSDLSNPLVAGTHRFMTGSKTGDFALYHGFESANRKEFEGVLIGGRCSFNYFHWIIEYLPRVLFLEAGRIDPKVPLVVPKGLPKNLLDALHAANFQNRPIILVDDSEVISFERLYIPSMVTYIPDRYDIPYWKTSLLPSIRLKELRDRILGHVVHETSGSSAPVRKIYLARKSNLARGITNRDQVEELFVSQGFEKVFPETLTFSEQVRLFSEASVIAGPGGAAMTNILFCSPGARVIAIIDKVNRGFCLHSNIAEIAGADFSYFLADGVASQDLSRTLSDFYHSEIKVDVARLSEVLKSSYS